MKKIIALILIGSTWSAKSQVDQFVLTEISNSLAEYDVMDVDRTADLGYLILSRSTGSGIAITKLDASGNLSWDAGIGVGPGIGNGTIQELQNGNIVFSYPDANSHVRVIYLNSAGVLIWAKQITHSSDIAVGGSAGVRVDESNPSFPTFHVFGSVGVDERPFTSELWSTGSTTYDLAYGNYSGMTGVSFNDLVLHSSGFAFGVAGTSTEKYIMKLTTTSGFLNQLNVTAQGLTLLNIIENSAGNLVAVGFMEDSFGSQDAAIIEVEPTNLTLIQARTFGTSNNEKATCVVQNSDNSYSLGVEDHSTGSAKMAIYKLDGGMNLEWVRAYGGDGTDSPSNIFQKADGGWTLIGGSSSFSPSTDIYMVMTNDQGITVGCQEELDYVAEIPNTIYVNLSSDLPPFVPFTTNNAAVTIKNTDAGYIPPYPSTSIALSNPPCFGSTGSADLTVVDGVIPYTFEWSNGTTAEDIVNVFQGTYQVAVIDNNGCVVHDTLSLVEPPSINTMASKSDVTCAGASDGAVDLTVSGGTPGYTYLWTYNNETSEDLSNVPGGFYQVTITDNNGCTANQAVSVSEPSPLVAGLSSSVNPLCHDDCNGSLGAIATGGTGPYNYLWNDVSAQTTPTATNLCSGNYLVTVTDANGCTTISSGGLQNPDELFAMVSTTASECGLSSGSGVVVGSGGVLPYNYLWPLGSTTDSESGLDIGSYSVQLTDANGCQVDESFDIGANTLPVEMCVVTVNDFNQNVVVWEKPIATNLAGFNVYRNVGGIYTQIGFTPYDSLSIFVDTEFGIDPNVTSYRYKIAALDTCGGESALSDFHETIHLTSSLGTGTEVNLIWDNYEGFSFVEYEIWRDTTGLGFWELIATVPNTNFTYVDNTLPAGIPQVAYAIDVLLPTTCTATTKAQDYNSSRSNRTGITAPGSGSGIEEEILASANIYPNPTTSVINIEVAATDWNYAVYDLSGRQVSEETQVNDYTSQLELGHLESGIYLIELSLNGQRHRHRVVKN